MSPSFTVNLSYQGKTVSLDGITTATTGMEFHKMVHETLQLSPEEFTLKLLLKGKRIEASNSSSGVFSKAPSVTKAPKILVMASARTQVEELNSKKQDPTIRGFDQEKNKSKSSSVAFWGSLSQPSKDYKFGRLQECPFHEFGHRPTDTTPHAFAARELLQRLASDPGVIAILKERELVVGTLGEMDPIDDRIMQSKQKEGGNVLGYNTNRGLRIDIKLRTDDLSGFRPYPELVSTLIHELSHNWVGDHNELFWANYGQMRIEYFVAHYRLQSQLYLGKTSAELAQLPTPQIFQADNILKFVFQELVREMAQHGLHPQTIQQPLQQRFEELQSTLGQRLGGGTKPSAPSTSSKNARELALEAAERRMREQQQQQQQQKEKEEQ